MVSVSVIIPAYNAAPTLAGTLQSVFRQTYQDFEIWVVDDGSTDETQAVVKAQRDPRVHLLVQANRGAAAARNAGLAASQGELVAFLDADDRWTPEKLEAQVAALVTNGPEVAVAYSWTDYIDGEDQLLYSGSRAHHSGDVYSELFCHNFIESGSNVLVRREALTHVGGFDSSLRAVEDWELWLRLAEQYHFVLVSQAQVLYRVRPESNSSDLSFQERTLRRVLESALARSPQRLAPHRRDSLTNIYQYLMFRTLSLGQTRRQYLGGVRYLMLVGFHGPAVIWRRSRLMAITVAKLALGLLLSPVVLRQRLALR